MVALVSYQLTTNSKPIQMYLIRFSINASSFKIWEVPTTLLFVFKWKYKQFFQRVVMEIHGDIKVVNETQVPTFGITICTNNKKIKYIDEL